jgi:hypothetical protein
MRKTRSNECQLEEDAKCKLWFSLSLPKKTTQSAQLEKIILCQNISIWKKTITKKKVENKQIDKNLLFFSKQS